MVQGQFDFNQHSEELDMMMGLEGEMVNITPEQRYDAVHPSIQDWAAARAVDEVIEAPGEYTSKAKRPTVPFVPLSREIGLSPVEDTEVLEMNLDRQQVVSTWVGKVKKTHDLIQRAESSEKPSSVYYGGQERAVKNVEPGKEKALLRGKSGRAAVRRQFVRTREHYVTARDRIEKGTEAAVHLKHGQPLNEADNIVLLEVLQELANGLAANLDNKFPGGDVQARIFGNSVLAVAQAIETGRIDPATQKRLVYAAIGYIRKQQVLWYNKLSEIKDFASKQGFKVGQPKPEKA